MLLNRKNIDTIQYPDEKIIQFGEGNFLRAFVDWMVQEINETVEFNGSVVVVQPIENGRVDVLNEQDGLFHTVLKGIKNGKPLKDIKVISSISRGVNPYTDFSEFIVLAENPTLRFVVSNTTEAGIAFDANDSAEMKPPKTFPAKLTVLLYHRYKYFKGDTRKGFIILPCELIEDNANVLKDAILKYSKLWKLEQGFIGWIEKCNTFCNTLVDRIVPGFSVESYKEIHDRENLEDKLCVDAEQFYLWIIEGADWIKNEFPADKAGLNVHFVKDLKPYRTRKVRILNGAHTLMSPVALLCDIEYVGDAVEHPIIRHFILNSLLNEIIPTLNSPADELKSFANEVLDRFRNPFVKHALMSISLNAVSKFKTRVLPTLKSYVAIHNKLPQNIVTSLAALIVFYSGRHGDKLIHVQDDAEIVEFFKNAWNKYNNKKTGTFDITRETLENLNLWGEDLTEIEGLESQTKKTIDKILRDGMLSVVKSLNS